MSRFWYAFTAQERFGNPGVNDAWVLTSQSIGKENSPESPYLLANEWICGRIAQFLCLPIPPFAMMRRPGMRGMFASLRFGKGDQPPSDCDPEILARAQPRISTGIVLFDALIANSDRHVGNLYVDRPSRPRRVIIFDHDRAMFGSFDRYGIRRLTEMRDRLAMSGGSRSGGWRHCLMDYLETSEHFSEWIDRIAQVPEWFIRHTCGELNGLNIEPEELEAAIDFLIYRRDRMWLIVNENRDEFPRISSWGLYP